MCQINTTFSMSICNKSVIFLTKFHALSHIPFKAKLGRKKCIHSLKLLLPIY